MLVCHVYMQNKCAVHPLAIAQCSNPTEHVGGSKPSPAKHNI